MLQNIASCDRIFTAIIVQTKRRGGGIVMNVIKEKILISLLALLVLLLIFSCASANTIETAETIELNTFISGTTPPHPGGYGGYQYVNDYYRFTLPSDGAVSVTAGITTDETYNSYNIYIIDKDGNKYLRTGFNFSTGGTSYRTGMQAGTYYLLVERMLGACPYQLRVDYQAADDWETEFNNSLETSDPIPMNTEMHGILWGSSVNDNVDTYRFQLDAPGFVSLTFGNYTGEVRQVNWVVTLTDAEKYTYLKTTFYGMKPEYVTSHNVGLPAGTYYFYVNFGAVHEQNAEYAVKLNYTAAADWETEPNDTADAADAISANAVKKGAIVSRDDVDYFRLSLDHEQSGTLSFLHQTGADSDRAWTIAILNQAENAIYQQSVIVTDSEEMVSDQISLQPGVYYIRVMRQPDFYPAFGDYAIRWNSPENPETTAPEPTPTAEPDITPPPEAPDPVIGDTITVDGLNYRIIEAEKVSFVGLKKAKSKTTVIIPATVSIGRADYKVAEIAAKALYKDTKVKTITIGKNVKTIGKNAFASCSKLTTVKGGEGIVTINDSAFSGCKVLKTFPAMGKLQSIGARAFKGCVKLTKFTLAAKVKSIGKNAFNGCKGLKNIDVKTTKLTDKNVGAAAFKGIYKTATFKCPKKKLKAYKELFIKKGAPKTCIFE